MLSNESKTGKGITQKITLRIIYSALLTILGIASLYVGIHIPLASDHTAYSSEFYTGIGVGLIVASITKIIMNVRLLKNKDALKRREIYESDERNRMIGLKCWSYTGYAMFIFLYIALLFAAAMNVIVMQTILLILAAFAVCLLVSRCILKRIM